MAGAGFKTFSAGTVLTAAEVNTYLMQQSVMVFGGTAARSSAIPSPSEGMVTYLSDLDDIQAYNGSSWISTGLTAGTTTANFGWPIPASGSIASLGTAIDTTVAGLSSGALTLISTTSFSAVASQSINDVFSATYENYVVMMSTVQVDNTNLNFRFRVSGADNSTSNYGYHTQTLATDAATYSALNGNNAAQIIIATGNGTNNYRSIAVSVFRPFLTDYTGILGNQNVSGNSGANVYKGGAVHGSFAATTSFTGFSIFPNSGNISGKISVYGVEI